ncbi:MAG: GAF domain-containing protein [Pseudomonadota bacterium]|nr:GAF domain-containing protein [Pseudomonadota bacterium]
MDTINTGVEGSTPDVGAGPRSIQSSGFLLALTEDWRVQCASANVGSFLGLGPDEVIGSAASDLLVEDAIHALRNRLALLRDPDGIERLFACQLLNDDRLFDIAIQMASHQVILEAEPSSTKLYGDVTGTLRGMMARLEKPDDLPAFCAAGARQMRALTGFDRVMVTRLDGDGSGTVVAEAARGSLDRLVGAPIPTTGLAAHELAAFRRTALYAIADVEAEPVTIVGGSPRGEDAPDLARAVLRSASDGQLNQLRLMGARSSVSIALEVDGQLWGMISCHHNAPRRISFERRAMAELFAGMFALRIEIAELKSALARGSVSAV